MKLFPQVQKRLGAPLLSPQSVNRGCTHAHESMFIHLKSHITFPASCNQSRTSVQLFHVIQNVGESSYVCLDSGVWEALDVPFAVPLTGVSLIPVSLCVSFIYCFYSALIKTTWQPVELAMLPTNSSLFLPLLGDPDLSLTE